jgi:hypothetical protein
VPTEPDNAEPPGSWYVYELPRPHLGNDRDRYSDNRRPGHGDLSEPDFDYSKRVVLASAVGQSLVPARDIRLPFVRSGLYLSGQSDDTSLVILPQQPRIACAHRTAMPVS